MTKEEAKEAIKDIPLGSTLQIVKSNGDIIEVKLMSKDIDGIAEKDYGSMKVPELPPALTVVGGTRFGKFRIDLEEISHLAWVS